MRMSPLITLLLISTVHSYKILVYNPRFGQSINNFLGNIADILVDQGHDVTTLIPIINPNLRDGTHKSKKIYVQQAEEVKKLSANMDFETADFFGFNDFNPIAAFMFGSAFTGWFNAHCPGVLDEPGLIAKLKEEKFDVMIIETFETCGLGISHLIKPKAIITTAGAVPDAFQKHEFGMESALSYNPNSIMSHLDVHSFSSRLWNLYSDLIFKLTFYKSRTQIDALFKERYGSDFPSVKEIASHSAYTLINTEPLIEFATPLISRVLLIGGIGAKEPKKLEKDLDHLFTLCNKTVLISFGSVVVTHLLPLKVKQTIVKAVSQFPHVTFIWKYEKPTDDFAKEVLASTPNLHMLAWTPQNDLLADERLTAFVTHGGMQSTQETALRGKPGLFIPFMGDQPRNSGMMEKNGVGKVFSKYDLFYPEKLAAAIKDLIENESYRINAARIAAMIQKKPFSARDQVVKSIEFAAEFGPAPALRPAMIDMGWVEFYNLDIITIIFVVCFTFVGVGIFALSRLIGKILGSIKFKKE